jgi:hypothetical protein
MMGPLGLCSESIRTYACQKIFDFGQTKNFQDLLDPFWKKSKPIDPEKQQKSTFWFIRGGVRIRIFFE